MKKLIYLIIASFLLIPAAYSQTVPQGMKYQAVARDVQGAVLSGQPIELRISLKGDDKTVHYTELHKVVTSELGLFNLVIGEGVAEGGLFRSVPWSSEEIWMEVSIKEKGKDFVMISSSKLLAVPYAFHAGTASELSGDKSAAVMSTQSAPGTVVVSDRCETKFGIALMRVLYLGPSGVTVTVHSNTPKRLLTTFTNVQDGDILTVQAAPAEKKLSHETIFSVSAPGVAVTTIPTKGDVTIVSATYNNFSVMSVMAYQQNAQNPVTEECSVCDLPQIWKVNGNVLSEMCNRLGTKNKSDVVLITDNTERMRISTGGDINIKNSVDIDKNLNVDGSVVLNTGTGTTVNNGPLTVARVSPTLLTGTLTVDKQTNLNSSLSVNNGSPTALTGTLTVTEATTLNNSLSVMNQSPTYLSGTLLTDKDATFKQKVLLDNAAHGSQSPSTGALVVAGGVGIGENLNVGGNTKVGGTLGVTGATTLSNTLAVASNTTLGADLHVAGASTFVGQATFEGPLKVTNATSSSNTTTGAAVVTGGVGIGENLNVGGAAALGSTLTVAGASSINNSLSVSGVTNLGNNLNVTGATSLSNNLTVSGATVLEGLTVNKPSTFNADVTLNSDLTARGLTISSADDAYVAVFENTNGGNGDGLKIKLGKTHPMWSGSSYMSVPNIAADAFQGPIDVIRGWVINHNPMQASDLLNIFPASMMAGTVVNLVNTVTGKINSSLGLPYQIGPYGIPGFEIMPRVTVFPEICIPEICFGALGCTPGYCTPAVYMGSYGMPAVEVIPRLTVMPAIPMIPSAGLPSMSVPNMSFSNVSNSLTNENEFMRFTDKDNRVLGSIKAQSVLDFSADYLDGVYFVNLMSNLVGLDIVSGIAGGIAGFTDIADAYNNIGVEYASGHGDYAEWLERENPNEIINAGDIVSVKAGKVTKNLAGAEQIMVVSYRPMVLGNMPAEGQEYLGNKIAFKGQVPVKITGAVNSGDYIIADISIPGFAKAIHPSKMTADLYKYYIGRSWVTNNELGPKLVNTLVGTDQAAFITVVEKAEAEISDIDLRVTVLEQQLEKIKSAKNTKANKK